MITHAPRWAAQSGVIDQVQNAIAQNRAMHFT